MLFEILSTLAALMATWGLIFLLICVFIVVLFLFVLLTAGWLLFPILAGVLLVFFFKLNVAVIVFHLGTLGLFSSVWRASMALCRSKLPGPNEEVRGALAPVVRVLSQIFDFWSSGLVQRLYIVVGFQVFIILIVTKRVVTSGLFWACLALSFLVTFLIWSDIVWFQDVVVFLSPHFWNSVAYAAPLLNKWRLTIQRVWAERRQIRLFYRDLLACALIVVLVFFYEMELIVHRNNPRVKQKIKFAKVMRSMSMAFAKVVESARLPHVFFNASQANMTQAEVDAVNSSVDEFIEFWAAAGYPIDPHVVETTPIYGIADGAFDFSWLVTGTSWRISAPQLKCYIQPEFRKFQSMITEYKPSFSYQTVDNQLESISRYFYDPENKFPEPDDVLDVVWPMVKEIYANSAIMPVWAIYKSWNKKFNLGAFAVSNKRKKDGTFRKMPRREWINSIGPKGIIDLFTKFGELALLFDTYGQFFTKREWLKPSKWMNDVVRTPVSAMLPEYIIQMVVSGVQNKRFEYVRTPIKLGMPMKHGTFEAIWTRHARFPKHFAGDCTAFDSTIVGPVISLIKAVRAKGFENHKDYALIERVIDRTYNMIESARLISSTTGNVYRKGSGLMTGHASTSSDNSLAMVAYYLVAWKSLTGRSAEEFRRYNELTVYGDDHVLSISELAPVVWTWNNIASTMKTWGVEMREEVPSGGKGVPLTRVPFLKKFPKVPSSADVVELHSIFGEGFKVPEFITYHDPDSLMGKAMALVLNKEPTYRVKRLISFLGLTAHNPDAYKGLHEGIEAIFKRYPAIREQQGKYVPSYKRVIELWYTQNLRHLTSIDEDPDLQDDLVTLNDSIVLYGDVTPWDRISGILSMLPDVVNPALRVIGPLEFMMRTYRHTLSWPKQVVARANRTSSKGHLEQILNNTCYDFLTKEVPCDINVNDATLLVRHWLYNLACVRNNYSFAYRLTGLFSKLINLNFLITGFVSPVRPKFAISYWNLALVALLSNIVVPDFPLATVLINTCKMPDIVGFVDDSVTAFWNRLWHVIPPSFRDVDVALGDPTRPQFVVEAPTASGKSTAMVHSVGLSLPGRVIVIEPRVALCTGLAGYMNTAFPVTHGWLTGETTFDEDAKVLYITPQYFVLAYTRFFGHGHQFIVDEFHVPELPMRCAIKILLNAREKVIFTSATPIPLDRPLITLVSTNVYGYERHERNWQIRGDAFASYAHEVQMISRGHNPWMRHLVFVDSFAELEALESVLPGRIGTISSRGTNIPNDVTFILATSSADVGVTIPNVDIVITKDFSMSLGPRGIKRYRLSSQLLKQRAGRTGRTNNGHAYVLRTEGGDVQPENDLFPLVDVLVEMVRLHPAGTPFVLPNIGGVRFEEFSPFFMKIINYYIPVAKFDDHCYYFAWCCLVASSMREHFGNQRLRPGTDDYDDVSDYFDEVLDFCRHGAVGRDWLDTDDVASGSLVQNSLFNGSLRAPIENIVGMDTAERWRELIDVLEVGDYNFEDEIQRYERILNDSWAPFLV